MNALFVNSFLLLILLGYFQHLNNIEIVYEKQNGQVNIFTSIITILNNQEKLDI